MGQSRRFLVSRRALLAGGTALAAGTLGSPAIVGAQPASVKVGLIHPVTGFVAYNGQQSRLGATMAIDDVNKAGGIKAMGGAKLEPLLGDSQSKVEVGVSEVEKMNEQGVAAYIGCFQSPVGIAASQAAAKYNTPFLIDVGASDLLVTRGLKNIFRLKPGFGVCVDQGLEALDALNKAASGVAKSAVIVHESGEFGTGTGKLLSGKLPSIGIQVKEVISHDNPTRNFDNIALRIRSIAPDLVMMSNYQNEYVLLGADALPAEGQSRRLLFVPGRWLQLQVRQGDARRLAVHDGHQPLVQPEVGKGAGAEEAGRSRQGALHLRALPQLLGRDAARRCARARRLGRQGKALGSAFCVDLQGRPLALWADQICQRSEPGRPGGDAAILEG